MRTAKSKPQAESTAVISTSRAKRPYAKWRIVSLVCVHVLVLLHFLHWKLFGRTLAPLEFSEVMETLNVGIITAGFVFMLVAFASVLLFGRFFCSWGCHMVAVQDLSAWLLKKAGITPKPIRSRLLLLVPMGVMFYMFVLPLLRRLTASLMPGAASVVGAMPPFEIRVTSDNDGFASFITDDFWRNLPGIGLAAVTFLVCGFAIIYFLGSRSFCSYACPYGALFGIADRAAFGQILLTGKCIQCAKCTAACPSSVRVHEEVIRYGKVIDPGCFKDLYCITVCPEEALSYGFDRPVLFAKPQEISSKPAVGKKYDFTLAEDLAMLAVFAVTLAIFVGLPDWVNPWAGSLYGQASLFLGLSLSVITAVVVIYLWRLARGSFQQFRGFTLKAQGRISRAGMVFALLAAGWLLFVGHSAIVQYHMYHATRAVDRTSGAGADALRLRPVSQELRDLAREGQNHVRRAAALGIFGDQRLPRQEAWLALVHGDLDQTEYHLRQSVAMQPSNPDSIYQLGRVLALEGKCADAAATFYDAEAVSKKSHRLSNAVIFGAEQLDTLGLTAAAVRVLEESIQLHPTDARVYLALAKLKREQGDTAEAERLIEQGQLLQRRDAVP